MIVTSTSGEQVSLIENKHGILVDTLGRWWTRNADFDTEDAAGYMCGTEGTMRLTRAQLKRVCQGTSAMQQLTTVAEMRDFGSRLKANLREITDNWNDQQLREILSEADMNNKSCISLFLSKLNAECSRREAEAAKLLGTANEVGTEEYPSCEREGISFEPERSAGTNVPPKKKAQRKPKEYAFEGVCDGVDVKLTSKQVLILQAILHNTDTNLNCSTASVLKCVANSISPISAGAVLSTLKEKGIISMDKITGTVSPTKLGAQVLNTLTDNTTGGTNNE